MFLSMPPHMPATVAPSSTIAQVPFYSQFKDISSPKWQKVGCGIASLDMVLDYYLKDSPSVDTLLSQGIKAGAYSPAGWTYSGLIGLANKYGLTGSSYDYASEGQAAALSALKEQLKSGPVIASVHYKFDPKNPIPHLVVIDGIDSESVYYNDPATTGGGKKIAVSDFLKAWKLRFIVIRPTSSLSVRS